MEINVTKQAEYKLVEVQGRIDTTTAPEFESRLLQELEEGMNVRIDFAQVEYLSSAGLRALLNSQKYCNKEKIDMILFNVAESVMEVFEMTGFADILTIE